MAEGRLDRRAEDLAVICRERALGVLRVGSAVTRADALARVDYLVDELGLRAIEVTRDSADCWAILPELVARVGDRAVVGMGSILDAADVRLAAEAGARIAVSPVNPPGFVAACREARILACPGCATPQEVFAATSAGAELVKLFPAQLLGQANLRAMRGVGCFKATRFVAMGGVDERTAPEWIAAGCTAVGVGARLCGGDIGSNDPAAVPGLREAYMQPGGGREAARRMLAALREP